MKLGIMQPYLFPYIGYFQLIYAVDKYVVYDDVNFIKGGWINRNNILIGGEKKLFTISLKEASPNKFINEIFIRDDFKKLIKTLEINYHKAPHYIEVMTLLNKIISFPNKQLSLFIANSFNEIFSYLNINKEIIISSNLNKNCSLKATDKVIHICKILGADTYYNAIGGRELYNKKEFRGKNINLFFLNSEIVPYKQFKEGFIPNLSIIDILMFNNRQEINALLNSFELI